MDSEPRLTTLPSGVRVVTDTMPGARSVTTGVWVGVGGRDEPDALAGASHFLEHLFFKGTEEWSARAIAEAVDAVGGDMNAFTAREHTAFHTRLPARHWRLGVDLLGDILTSPALREHELDSEREVILEELWAALDSPEDRVHAASLEGLFGSHPLGREVLGTPETVRDMTRDDVHRFFATHYRPANLVVAAAGAVDHDDVCAAVAERLTLPEGGIPPERRAPSEPPAPLVTWTKDGEQVHVILGWRGIAQDDPDRYALAVANQILGGGTASRLFQSIREDAALAYSVYSWTSCWSDSGMLGIYAGTSPNRTSVLLDRIDEELSDILDGGITERELDVAIGYLEGATELGLEDSGGRMTRLGRLLMIGVPLLSVDEQLARVRAVTMDDVNAVLRRVLGGPRSVAAVGPIDVDALTARV